jgi:hypothetical protein
MMKTLAILIASIGCTTPDKPDYPPGFCSVKTQEGCSGEQACYPTWGTEYGYCATPGIGQDGAPCRERGDSDCEVGYSCGGTCHPICFSPSDCSGNETCQIPSGGLYTDYGMCLVP